MTARRRLGRLAATVMVLGIALAACGSTDPGVTPSAARSLHDGVRIVRLAAAAGDRDGAVSATRNLEAELTTLRADGRVSADAGARIRRAIARVRADLALIPTTTTTTTTTTTVPPAEDQHGKAHGKDHGKHDD
jgi:hypothetical protein